MIHIIQCLCPSRHCIFGVAYDPADMEHDVAMATFQQQVEQWIEKKEINPWCGICGSRDWKYEMARTKYTTMQEAATELAKEEAKQMESRRYIDQLRGQRN